jgi:hypothetical protein
MRLQTDRLSLSRAGELMLELSGTKDRLDRRPFLFVLCHFRYREVSERICVVVRFVSEFKNDCRDFISIILAPPLRRVTISIAARITLVLSSLNLLSGMDDSSVVRERVWSLCRPHPRCHLR